MKVVIVGAGAVGTHLSKLLSREHQDCVLIDDDDERLSALSEYDVMTYNASPTSIKALKEAGVQHADLFVGVTTDGQSVYGDIGKPVFTCPKGQKLAHLYLVVMGAPTEHVQLYRRSFSENGLPAEDAGLATFPYEFRIRQSK